MLDKKLIFNPSIDKKLNKELPAYIYNQTSSPLFFQSSPFSSYTPPEVVTCLDIHTWSPAYSWFKSPIYEPPPFNTRISLNYSVAIWSVITENGLYGAFDILLENKKNALLSSLGLLDALKNSPQIYYLLLNQPHHDFNTDQDSLTLMIYTVLTEEQAHALEALFRKGVTKGDAELNWSYDFFDDNIAAYMLRNPINNCYTFAHGYSNYNHESNFQALRKRIVTTSSITNSEAMSFVKANYNFKRKLSVTVTGLGVFDFLKLSACAEGLLAAIRIYFLFLNLDECDSSAIAYVDSSKRLIIDVYLDNYDESIWKDIREVVSSSAATEYLNADCEKGSEPKFELTFFEDQLVFLPSDVNILSVANLRLSEFSYELFSVYDVFSKQYSGPPIFFFEAVLLWYNIFVLHINKKEFEASK